MNIKQLENKLLNSIYPPTCEICGKIGTEIICKKCETVIEGELESKLQEYSDKEFASHLYLFEYSGIIRKKLIQYKFKKEKQLAKLFAKIMLKNERLSGFLKQHCDIIIPVPIHKKRQQKRGYNQSELILREYIRSNKEVCIETKALYKIKNTKPQSSLDKRMRTQNIENAYQVKNKEKIIGKNIALFDDIYTTGSTVEECSKVLKQAGAKTIYIITIAKD
ncbi:MAG: ComF family protein [Clostridia bacterium]